MPQAIDKVTKHKDYGILRNIKSRCLNEKYRDYYNYGGRGITICKRWLESDGDGFRNFIEDMGERPSSKHSIERIDNNKGYTPDNCKWATSTEQANNKRTNRMVLFRNKKITISTLIREYNKYNINPKTIRERISTHGWSAEDALFKDVNEHCYNFIVYNGGKTSLKELAKKYNIKYTTLYQRVNRSKMELEEALKF